MLCASPSESSECTLPTAPQGCMSLDDAFCRFGVAHQLLEMRLDVISGAAGGPVRPSFFLEDAEGHTGSLARVQPIVRDKARRLPHGLHNAGPDVVIDGLARLGIEPVVPHNPIHSPAPESMIGPMGWSGLNVSSWSVVALRGAWSAWSAAPVGMAPPARRRR